MINKLSNHVDMNFRHCFRNDDQMIVMDVNAIYNVKCWPKAHLYAQVNFVRLQSSEMSRTQFLMI